VRSIDLAMDSFTAGCVSTLRDDNDTGSLIPILFRQSANNGSTFLTRMVIDAAGNVGIGTTNPGNATKLEVRGQIGAQNWLALWNSGSVGVHSNQGNDPRAAITFGGNDSQLGWFIGPVENASAANTDLGFYKWVGAGAGWNMVLKDGNVGIGTTSPQGALHVKDGDGYYLVKYVSPINSATPIVVIPNGAGDVTKIIQFEFVVTDGTNSTASSGSRTPGGAVVDATLGTNTFRMTVNADGSVDVRRQAGTGTLSAMFEFKWI